MRTEILLIYAIMSGILVVTIAAEQTNKNYSDRQMSQNSKTVTTNSNPNADDLSIINSEGTWGLHEPLKNCILCHRDISVENSPDKKNLAAPVPALCYICHEQYDKQGGWVHGPVATGECLLCHNAHKTNTEALLSKPIPELCHNCHEPEMLEPIAYHSDKSYAHCNVCHDSHVSESRMLLKNHFLNADEGLIYISKEPSSSPRPKFVDRQNSLSGLQGVEVVPVVDGTELFKRYGVTEDLVRTEVERQLRQNGIKILHATDQIANPPSLQVYLRLMEVPSFRRPEQVTALSGSFNIFLQQTVELLSGPGDVKGRYCAATTWDTSAILIWGTSQIEEGLKEAVEVLVGRFIKDYLAANPKNRISLSINGDKKPSGIASEETTD